MRALVLGGGLMGRAAAYDLCRQPDIEEVTVADIDATKAEEAVRLAQSPKASSMRLDVKHREAALDALREADTALGAVSYTVNLELTKLAVEAGTHWCDMGGNNDVVSAQLALNDEARAAGVSVIPDTGLAPGMVSLLAIDGIGRMDSAESAHLRVGGLPVDPKPPLDYALVFSVEGLVNEYVEPCVAIRGGRVVDDVEPLGDVEEIEFPSPFGTLEAFNTSGGTSTLPRSLEGKITDLDYKTIRYPGHAARVRTLLDLGLMSEEPVDVDGVRVSPRALLEKLIARSVPWDENDVVLVRVTVDGRKDARRVRATYEMVDYLDERSGLSAMMRGTAFPSATICAMMGRGETPAGALPQELAIESGRFIEELRSRGLPVETKLETLA
ncbi:MAG: saccharopine dehydrogenase [Candidatus Eisenbacteria bacterium]|nr:saccharopine dehydrogenase [Candidatus Eisenbacteria bacterium]